MLALLARALGAGIVAFVMGGSFISRENSELIFLYVIMAAMLSQVLAKQGEQAALVRKAAAVGGNKSDPISSGSEQAWGMHEDYEQASSSTSARYVIRSRKNARYVLKNNPKDK